MNLHFRAFRPLRALAVLLACTALTAGCEPVERPDTPTALPPVQPGASRATPQSDGTVGSLRAIPRARVS